MKKSGILMLLGPLVIVFGMIFQKQIATLILGPDLSVQNYVGYSGPSQLVYKYANGVATSALLGGLAIFILGCIFAVIEKKKMKGNTSTSPRNEKLQALGIVIFICILLFIFFVVAYSFRD